MKKGNLNFSNYLVFMFLAVSLLGVIGGLTSSLLYNYNVSTSSSFNEYMNTFDANEYADQNKLEVQKSDSESEFSLYESSFQFGDQIKQTQNQTNTFVKETSRVLGLPAQIWYIIIGVVTIIILVAIVYFIRGLSQK